MDATVFSICFSTVNCCMSSCSMAAVSGGESGMDSGCGLLRTAFPKKQHIFIIYLIYYH